ISGVGGAYPWHVTSELVVLPDDTFVVFWEQADSDGTGTNIYGQRVDANGDFIGQAFVAHNNLAGEQSLASADVNAEGNVVIAWHTNAGGDNDIQSKTLTFSPELPDATISGTDAGSVTEDVDPNGDGIIEVSAQLTIVDPDNGEDTFVAETLVGDYGTLTIDASGNWTYLADNSQSAIQLLNTGENLQDIFTVQSVDGTTKDVTVTIEGANSPATAAGPHVVQLLSSGAVTDFSLGVDNISLVSGVTNGILTFSGDGTISYTPNTGYVGTDGFSYMDIDGAVTEVAITVGEEYEPADTMLVDVDPSSSGGWEYTMQPGLEAMPGGGFALIWSYQHGAINAHREIHLQIFDVSGARLLPDEGIRVNQTYAEDQWYGALSVGDNGNIVIVWQNAVDNDSPPDYDIMARVYDASGQALTNEFVVAQGDAESDLSHINTNTNADVTHLSDDRFVVVGQNKSAQAGHPWGVWVRVYEADGTPDSNTFGGVKTTIFDPTDGSYGLPDVAQLDDGGFVVVATENGSAIVSKTFAADGTLESSDTVETGTAAGELQVLAIDDGYVVIWTSATGADADGYGVYAKVYNDDGTLRVDTFLVNAGDEVGNQAAPDGTATSDGGFIIGWHSNDGTDAGAYAQQFDANGQVAGDAVELAPNNVFQGPQLAAGDDGQIMAVTISDNRPGQRFDDRDIYGTVYYGASGLNDWLEGSVSANYLVGLAGDDMLIGLGGNDTLNPGQGDDTALGGSGTDHIHASSGDDYIDGGDGPDSIIFTGASTDYQSTDLGNGRTRIEDLRAGSPDGTDTIESGEHLVFTDFTTNVAPLVADVILPSANEDTVVVIDEATLLAGASDDDGDPLSVTSVSLVNSAQGTVAYMGGGVWHYTPASHMHADAVQLTFTVNDGYEDVVAAISVDINAVADAPDVTTANVSGDEDTSLSLNLSAALVDQDGSESMILELAGVPEGHLVSDGTNSFVATASVSFIDITSWSLSSMTITSPENYNGTFDLTVTATSTEASNGHEASTVQTLTVDVLPVNDTAIIGGDVVGSVTEDVAVDGSGDLVAG
ncbi:MAG: tandem-95 repeat protein, partial [Alphaproteobacteria bacterium]|nr:tandem-95 repeat protein [Alphaproteobacteria bacterium]